MKIKIVVHEAEEGGFWAEVPAIPGCATEGDTMDELMANLRDAIEGCLSVEVAPPEPGGIERILELPARSPSLVGSSHALSNSTDGVYFESAAVTTLR